MESVRQRGLFISGLKGLGLLKLSGRYNRDGGGRGILYHCLRCDRNVKKSTLITHYRMIHKEIYELITGLIKVWGLVSSTLESEELEEKFLEFE